MVEKSGNMGSMVVPDAGQPGGTGIPPSVGRLPIARRVVVVVLASVLVLVSGAGSAQAYVPAPGALFNDPIGSGPAKHRINETIDDAIDAAPKGSTIRIGQFSFTRMQTARKLIRAHRRGVDVRILVNDHQYTPAMDRVIKALGSNHKKRSYFIVCRAGCRGKGGDMHSKFLTFSNLGGRSNVVMVGSGNLTWHGGAWQWNDHVTIVGKRKLYRTFVQVFDQMARDKPVAAPYQVVTQGRFTAHFFPKFAGKKGDPIYKELNKVRCTGAGKAGRGGKTVVRIAMWSWKGDRGMYIARKLRSMDNAGCHVEVIVGGGSKQVNRFLRNSGIAFWDSRADRDSNGELDLGAHQKYVLISGNYGTNRSAKVVFTGSQNFTPASLLRNDEVLLKINKRTYFRQFNANWEKIRSVSRRR